MASLEFDSDNPFKEFAATWPKGSDVIESARLATRLSGELTVPHPEDLGRHA